jgi:hypothetical protein
VNRILLPLVVVGRPVRQALVTVMRRDMKVTASGPEHVYIEQLQADDSGGSSCIATEKPGDLMIRADSPDLKKVGVLWQLSNVSNTIVVRQT